MEEYNIIEVNDPTGAVNVLKMQASATLSSYYELLKEASLPKREDYNSEEEYQVVLRMQELELIAEIKDIKHAVFDSILHSYNDFITEKNMFEAQAKRENKESIEIIPEASKDMKITLAITIGGSVLLPIAAPILLVLNVPRIGVDVLTSKYHKTRLMHNLFMEEQFKRIQDPFYELVDTLRSDYHLSNKELKELEEKAINGENISNELLKYLDPRRVNLEKLTVEGNLLIPEPSMEYTKK